MLRHWVIISIQQQQQQQKSLNYGNNESKQNNNKTNAQYNDDNPLPGEKSSKQNKINRRNSKSPSPSNTTTTNENEIVGKKLNPADLLTAALIKPCAKCSKPTATTDVALLSSATTSYIALEPWTFKGSKNNSNGNSSSRQYRKSKSYVASSRHLSNGDLINNSAGHKSNSRHHYQRSQSDRRSSFDRHFAERNKNFVPIEAPARPILSSSYIYAVIADTEKLVILQRLGKGRITYPIMQEYSNLKVIVKKQPPLIDKSITVLCISLVLSCHLLFICHDLPSSSSSSSSSSSAIFVVCFINYQTESYLQK
ncbi:hypothetical protein DOY81_008768 [Sarcophaga bullata]|nr:hypothetical protein DOY81_008768 [Sarcophaga bullata]